MYRLNRVEPILLPLLLAGLLCLTGCGQNRKLLVGKWTRGFVSEMGSAPGEPLISIYKRNMTLYADGSLEVTRGDVTRTGKWTLDGNNLTLSPVDSPEETFAIARLDEGHLTLKAASSGTSEEEWTRVRDGS